MIADLLMNSTLSSSIHPVVLGDQLVLSDYLLHYVLWHDKHNKGHAFSQNMKLKAYQISLLIFDKRDLSSAQCLIVED